MVAEESQQGLPPDETLAGETFDVIVVEAIDRDGACALEVAVTTGPRKGDVLELVAVGLDIAGEQLLGLPATVTVTADGPRLTL